MTAAPARRWFRFSLRAFLVFAAIAPPLAYWGFRYVAARSAAASFSRTEQLVQDEVIEWDELWAESKRLRDCELAVPFSDKALACAAHADRVAAARKSLAIQISTDYPYEYWPRVSAAYAEALERLREVAGEKVANEVRSRHDADFPPLLKELGWGYSPTSATPSRSPMVRK